MDALETDELIARALLLDGDDENDDEEYWAIVADLQDRGDRRTFEAVRALCLHESDEARCLGVSVLGQLGYDDGRPFLAESVPLVLALCGEGASEDLLAVCMHALGSLGDARGIEPVLAQRDHADPIVRLAVAHAAEGVAGDPPDPRVLDAVIALSADADADVRDWATFSLGSLFEVDTPAVRDALFARIGDADESASAEALAGLSLRRDPRAGDEVMRRLQAAGSQPFDDPHVEDLIVESAARLGDPRFLPALRLLHARADRAKARALLADAIASCEGAP